MKSRRKKTVRKGVALLVVLFITMVITILSLGFLSRSDVELQCGKNMVLKTQMDYLAESGLEHAKGLILKPQDSSIDFSQTWAAVGQQLDAGSDYYDITVTPHDSNDGPTYRCNYDITCEAYREVGGNRIGRSRLTGELRLDPCIALWSGNNTKIASFVTVNGDVYCGNTLSNNGVIAGDVFAGGFSGNAPSGQQMAVGELSLNWPSMAVSDFTSHYTVQAIGASLSDTPFGPYDPVRVCYYGAAGDIELNGNVEINGMLMVNGDLTVSGSGNVITAGRNLPALFVTGDLIIEDSGSLDVNGLAVIDGQVQVSSGAGDVNILGGLFTGDNIVETTADSSVNDYTATVYNSPMWQPSGGQINGALEFDGVDDYVQTPNDPDKLQLTGDYTLAVWLKADAIQKSWAGVFSKCSTSGSTNHWTLRFSTVTPRKLIIYHPSANWDTGINLSDVAGGWHHVAVVRDGDTMTSYLDGSSHRSKIWSNNPGSGDGHLNIGVDSTASPDYAYKGLLDDVRIYNSALNAGAINPNSMPGAGLIGHWKLDEDQSGSISITAAPTKTAIVIWPGGVEENWGQAEGAFFRSIERP